MNHDDEAGNDALARINLHAWRVPPASAADRPTILARALTPAAAPRRTRMKWLFAALAIANILLAAIVVVLAVRPPHERVVTIQRAMGGPLDAQTTEILRRLERDQRELEGKLAEVQQLRTLVAQLSDRVHQCDEADKRERTVSKQRREPPAPGEPAAPAEVGSCDEVSCVLSNYAGACCTKFRGGAHTQPPPPNPLPETLDRQNITNAIAVVRLRVSACAGSVKGKVKVRVRVNPDGRVADVAVESAPDPGLGACVASAIVTATFAPTQQGGSFSYPFIF